MEQSQERNIPAKSSTLLLHFVVLIKNAFSGWLVFISTQPIFLTQLIQP